MTAIPDPVSKYRVHLVDGSADGISDSTVHQLKGIAWRAARLARHLLWQQLHNGM